MCMVCVYMQMNNPSQCEHQGVYMWLYVMKVNTVKICKVSWFGWTSGFW